MAINLQAGATYSRLAMRRVDVRGYGFYPDLDGGDSALAATTAVTRASVGASFESVLCADAIYPQESKTSGKTNYLDANGVLIQSGRILRVVGVPFVVRVSVPYTVFSSVTDKTRAVVELFECDTAFLVHDVFYKLTSFFTHSDGSSTGAMLAIGRDDKDVDENQNLAAQGTLVDSFVLPHEISNVSGTNKLGWGGVRQGTAKGVEHPSTDQLLYGAGSTALFPGGSQLVAYFEARSSGNGYLSDFTAGEVSFYMLVTILESPTDDAA